jgi:hypothetical protein
MSNMTARLLAWGEYSFASWPALPTHHRKQCHRHRSGICRYCHCQRRVERESPSSRLPTSTCGNCAMSASLSSLSRASLYSLPGFSPMRSTTRKRKDPAVKPSVTTLSFRPCDKQNLGLLVTELPFPRNRVSRVHDMSRVLVLQNATFGRSQEI